jgi:ADP-ribose pyrophosphatase YjhB (NUDIX family)
MPTFCWACGAALPSDPPTTCSVCGTAHWLNPKPSAAAFVEHERRLLLGRRALEPWAGCWGPPAGFCEVDELPAQTCERETREECGIDVRVTDFLGIWLDTYARSPVEHIALYSICYRAEPRGTSELALDPTEMLEARGFEPDGIPSELAFPGHVPAAIEAWQRLRREA